MSLPISLRYKISEKGKRDMILKRSTSKLVDTQEIIIASTHDTYDFFIDRIKYIPSSPVDCFILNYNCSQHEYVPVYVNNHIEIASRLYKRYADYSILAHRELDETDLAMIVSAIERDTRIRSRMIEYADTCLPVLRAMYSARKINAEYRDKAQFLYKNSLDETDKILLDAKNIDNVNFDVLADDLILSWTDDALDYYLMHYGWKSMPEHLSDVKINVLTSLKNPDLITVLYDLDISTKFGYNTCSKTEDGDCMMRIPDKTSYDIAHAKQQAIDDAAIARAQKISDLRNNFFDKEGTKYLKRLFADGKEFKHELDLEILTKYFPECCLHKSYDTDTYKYRSYPSVADYAILHDSKSKYPDQVAYEIKWLEIASDEDVVWRGAIVCIDTIFGFTVVYGYPFDKASNKQKPLSDAQISRRNEIWIDP